MAKPMFFFAGVYDNVADADADYESIKALHSGDAIGFYDSAIISRDDAEQEALASIAEAEPAAT